MKVLVDSSAWIDFLNGHRSPESDLLARLVTGDAELLTCAPVVAEVFQGLRRDAERSRLEKLFRRLAWIEHRGIDSALRAARVFRDLRAAGITVRSTIDCLIAVLAEENGGLLLARDRDLAAIADSGLLRLGLLSAAGR